MLNEDKRNRRCSWNKKINLIWIALWEWAIQLKWSCLSGLPHQGNSPAHEINWKLIEWLLFHWLSELNWRNQQQLKKELMKLLGIDEVKERKGPLAASAVSQSIINSQSIHGVEWIDGIDWFIDERSSNPFNISSLSSAAAAIN